MRRPLLALLSVAAGCAPGATGQLGEAQTECPGPNILEGVDVSEYQQNVNWGAVAASGRAFAIARVSDGFYVDPYFAQNWNGIRAAGLVRGVYQFFRPTSDAVGQANLLLQHIGQLQPGDLAPALDVEVTDGASPATMNAQIHAWVDRIQAATGRVPIIYTGSYFWDDNVGTGDFAGNPLWLPAYGPYCPRLPNAWSHWTFHQFTSSGQIPGIGGNVDVSRFNGTLGDLQRLAGNTCTPHCEGTVIVGQDCGRGDCAASGATCLDQGGARCVGIPRGSLDDANCAELRGWVQDLNTPDSVSPVDLYFDAPAGAGPPSLHVDAGDHRDDLCAAIGSCNHGFDIDTPLALRDGRDHRVWAYGVSSADPGIYPLLGGSPREFRCAAPVIGDFDGDGRSDVIQYRGDAAGLPVCLSLDGGWSCRNLPATYVGGIGAGNGGAAVWDGAVPLGGHFNGDSWLDLFQFNSTWQSIPACLSLVSGWSCRNLPALSGGGAGNAGSGIFPGTTPLVGDVDGDGLSDVIQFNDGSDAIAVCRSLGSGWTCRDLHADFAGGDFPAGNGGAGVWSGATPLVGDFDGDGKSDVIQFNDRWQSIPVCLSLGGGWSCKNLAARIAGGAGNGVFQGATPLVADFDGDGRSDVIQYRPDAATIAVCSSLGDGWSCRDLAAPHTGGAGPAGNGGSGVQRGVPIAADFDGDGRADLAMYDSRAATLPLCLSLGTGWSCRNLAATLGPGGGVPGNGGSAIYRGGAPLAGDFDGDGRADLLQFQSDGWSSLPVCIFGGDGWICRNAPAVYTGGIGPGNGGSGIY